MAIYIYFFSSQPSSFRALKDATRRMYSLNCFWKSEWMSKKDEQIHVSHTLQQSLALILATYFPTDCDFIRRAGWRIRFTTKELRYSSSQNWTKSPNNTYWLSYKLNYHIFPKVLEVPIYSPPSLSHSQNHTHVHSWDFLAASLNMLNNAWLRLTV